MKPETKKKIHYIYSIVLSVALVITGLLLMAACVQIYLSGGPQTYTPEKVAAAFRPIAAPVYITLGLTLVSILMQLIWWQPADKSQKARQPAMQLRRLQLTRDPGQADEEKQAALNKLLKNRRTLWGLCIVICAACAAIFGYFAFNGNSYHPEAAKATQSVIGLMYVFGPCVTVALGYSVVTAYLLRKNTQKLIGMYKQCPPLPQAKTTGKKTAVYVIRYCVLGLSVALMVYGLISGGWQDVLTKAVNICTECVGLG